jgi:hypothetical protein
MFFLVVTKTSQNTTLLSEAQKRNNGLIVDSTSSRHLEVDNKPGTQCITTVKPSVVFPLLHQKTLNDMSPIS